MNLDQGRTRVVSQGTESLATKKSHFSLMPFEVPFCLLQEILTHIYIPRKILIQS